VTRVSRRGEDEGERGAMLLSAAVEEKRKKERSTGRTGRSRCAVCRPQETRLSRYGDESVGDELPHDLFLHEKLSCS
jgi:hypothetical protein